jgi:hypothetical protein
LKDIVMPGVATVEDSKGLGEVEVEEIVGGERPEAKVQAI